MNSGLTQKQQEKLLELGLSKTQLALYLASFQNGVLSVLELSKITGINRQQIYHDAQKLIDIGLYDITRKNRKKYIAAHPSKFVDIGEKKIEDTEALLVEIDKIIPNLETIPKSTNKDVIIRHFEGKKGIQRAYENELEATKNTEVLSFAGSIDHIFEFFPESYWGRWNRQFVKQKSTSKMLVDNSKTSQETSRLDKAYARDTRYIDDFQLRVNVDIFNNTVLIVSMKDEFAIWIDSRTLSESYRILFNTLWKLAKEFE